MVAVLSVSVVLVDSIEDDSDIENNNSVHCSCQTGSLQDATCVLISELAVTVNLIKHKQNRTVIKLNRLTCYNRLQA